MVPNTASSGSPEAILFAVQVPMKDRDLQTRVDVNYPFEKYDEETGKFVEKLEQPAAFDVRFIYTKGKRGSPMFKIFAQRLD